MHNHLHMVARADEGFDLSAILRDFKKFTSKAIVKRILDEPESRREWMLHRFEFAGKYLKRIEKYKVLKIYLENKNFVLSAQDREELTKMLDALHKNLGRFKIN